MSYSIERDYVRFDHPEGAEYNQIVNDLTDLMNNPALSTRMNFLIDLRSLPQPLEAKDMRRLARFLESVKDRLGQRFSYIVSQEVVYGMIRLLGAYLSNHGIEVEIFDNEEDAISWLGK